MDWSTTIIGTIVLGLVGAAVFLMMQPAQVKSRAAKGGLKPRGAPRTPHARPMHAEHPSLTRGVECGCLCAEDLYAQ